MLDAVAPQFASRQQIFCVSYGVSGGGSHIFCCFDGELTVLFANGRVDVMCDDEMTERIMDAVASDIELVVTNFSLYFDGCEKGGRVYLTPTNRYFVLILARAYLKAKNSPSLISGNWNCGRQPDTRTTGGDQLRASEKCIKFRIFGARGILSVVTHSLTKSVKHDINNHSI
jgi:hypothetical protein